MKISDLASSRVEVITSEVSVRQAAEKMGWLNVGALPVVDEDERVVGMITDRDIVCRVIAPGLDPKTTAVGEVMTVEVVSVSPDSELEEAVDLMQARQVRRLPLIDPEGHTTGIVALADLAPQHDQPDLIARLLAALSRPARTPQ